MTMATAKTPELRLSTRLIVVCDYPSDWSRLKDKFCQFMAKDIALICVDRRGFRNLLIDARNNPRRCNDVFLFARPKGPRLIIYDEDDKVDSFYTQINKAVKHSGGAEAPEPEIKNVIILVYDWENRNEIDEENPHDPKIWLETKRQPKLKIFEQQLFTLENGTYFNLRQKRLLEEVLGFDSSSSQEAEMSSSKGWLHAFQVGKTAMGEASEASARAMEKAGDAMKKAYSKAKDGIRSFFHWAKND
eukprot:m.41768 g.41768  ORF g.41768 m.41768 type:complete len:246 (+) comp33250_c0_seq1:155-892(+)